MPYREFSLDFFRYVMFSPCYWPGNRYSWCNNYATSWTLDFRRAKRYLLFFSSAQSGYGANPASYWKSTRDLFAQSSSARSVNLKFTVSTTACKGTALIYLYLPFCSLSCIIRTCVVYELGKDNRYCQTGNQHKIWSSFRSEVGLLISLRH
jgi:hypothetical protein